MNRFLTLYCLLLIGGCASDAAPTGQSTTNLVQTTSGPVAAQVNESVAYWRDIPYAQPPVGALRWRAPRPMTGPLVTIDTRDHAACLQRASNAGGVPGEGIVGHEDCLYLDVQAPASRDSTTALPVMFWIHGGGNTAGYKGYYDFASLVESQNVIVVTINYRLGPMGWLSHPAVQAGSQGLDRSSNFGTLDILQALHWVQDNIASFGGDPENVTIFGESAGGHNVFALLASPLSDGLFHKAISQSGYLETASVAEAINADDQFSRMRRSSSQLFAALSSAGALKDINKASIYALTGEQILEQYLALDGDGDIPLTTADGIVIPEDGMLAALSDSTKTANIPVIAGANRDEVTLWLGTHRYFVDADYPLTRLLPPRLRLRDPELYDFWISVRSRAWKLRGVDEPLAALAKTGNSSLFAYRFDWDDQESSFFADFPRIIGAAHGIDIAFVTGAYNYGPISSYVYPEGDSREEMRELMMTAWAGFARTGRPQLPIDWLPFSPAEREFVHLDVGDALRAARDSTTMAGLLNEVGRSNLVSELELCLLVWETLTRVGEPDYQAYDSWSQGQCSEVDATAEQAAINAAITAEHGSTSVM